MVPQPQKSDQSVTVPAGRAGPGPGAAGDEPAPSGEVPPSSGEVSPSSDEVPDGGGSVPEEAGPDESTRPQPNSAADAPPQETPADSNEASE